MEAARVNRHHALQSELARLEAKEVRVSALRRQLHKQIDFGRASGTTREREQKISAERRQLHRRIDALRDSLDSGWRSEADVALNHQILRVAGSLPKCADHKYGFSCEDGCGGTVSLTVAEYEREGGAWLEGHSASGPVADQETQPNA